jgi:DNA polymerase III alpha subunit
VKNLKAPFQELKIEFLNDEKKFKDMLQKQQVSVVGVIIDMRKIVTRTGKSMLFLHCEGFDYDFELTIFDKDYAEYKDKLEVGKIVIAEGTLDVNFDYNRKNIRSRKIVTASLTQVRDQAKDM